MARKTDIPRVQNPPSGDGHHITSRYMTATELTERDARQNPMTTYWPDSRHMKIVLSGSLNSWVNPAPWVACSPKAATSPKV